MIKVKKQPDHQAITGNPEFIKSANAMLTICGLKHFEIGNRIALAFPIVTKNFCIELEKLLMWPAPYSNVFLLNFDHVHIDPDAMAYLLTMLKHPLIQILSLKFNGVTGLDIPSLGNTLENCGTLRSVSLVNIPLTPEEKNLLSSNFRKNFTKEPPGNYTAYEGAYLQFEMEAQPIKPANLASPLTPLNLKELAYFHSPWRFTRDLYFDSMAFVPTYDSSLQRQAQTGTKQQVANSDANPQKLKLAKM